MQKFLKILVSKRFIILSVSGAALYLAVSQFHLSLWYILLAGIVLGVVFGKVFCRWVCPMGLIMELIMSMSPDGKFRQMYQYHKIGCPIAWISGWLNRYSLFKIELNSESCKKLRDL
jgi:polyferredoxin